MTYSSNGGVATETQDSDISGKVLDIPQPVNLVVKNFNMKYDEIDKLVIDGIWIPIRKQVRLLENVDIAMCFNKCTFTKIDENGEPVTVNRGEGKEPKEDLTPGIRFHFLPNSLVCKEEKVYQKLTFRDPSMEEDIRKHQGNASVVRVTYVTQRDYEEFQRKMERKARKLANKGAQAKPVILREMIREMNAPTRERIKAIMDYAIDMFIEELLEFANRLYDEKLAAGHTSGIESRPEVLSIKYDDRI